MKTPTSLLLIPLCLLAMGLATTSCKRGPQAVDSTQQSQISPAVWLHQARGNVLSITDKTGKALVAGNVLRALRVGPNGESLLVEYKPSTPDAGEAPAGGLQYAHIDLSSASVTPVPTPNGDTLKTLKPADLLLPLP